MKRIYELIIFLIILLLQLYESSAVEITLDECLNAAISKNKQQQNSSLLSEKNDLEEYNLFSNYYPQLSFEANATYQSDVMSLPIKLPNVTINEIPKENYQLTAQVQQLIWDGGSVSAAAKSKQIETDLQKNSVQITTQKLKENISSLYFSALLLQQNADIIQENIEFLQEREKQLSSMFENGVVLRKNLLSLQIEIENLEIKKSAILSDLTTLKSTLSSYSEIPELTTATLLIPTLDKTNLNTQINRSELKAYDYKNELLESGKESVSSQLMPKIAAFAKLGYGNPNPMNVFEEGAQTYYMAGINLQWKPFDWFKSGKSKEIININKQINTNDKYELKRSISNIVDVEQHNIVKYENLLTKDDKIIDMQTQVVDMSFSQFINGTITFAEYLSEVSKLTNSKINRSVHHLQKQMAINNLLIKTGNK